jgi:flagellar biosynthesis anti-sigma factor FlgM
MRIDQNLPISEAIQPERVSGTTAGQSSATSTPGTPGPDAGVSLNSQQLQAALEATPDIRQDKVASLRQAMGDGTYHVSSEDLAGAIYNALITKTNRP